MSRLIYLQQELSTVYIPSDVVNTALMNLHITTKKKNNRVPTLISFTLLVTVTEWNLLEHRDIEEYTQMVRFTQEAVLTMSL